MSAEIYDPQNPNMYGYRPYRQHSFIERCLLRVAFWIYGPGVVAWHLHRDQSFGGKLLNCCATYILRKH